jgi:RsiW-degrading membrane proteinase PrsW (M82 family)
MAHKSIIPADKISDNNNKKNLRELAILSSTLVVLLFLAARPFGFRNFLHELGHNNVFSLLLVASAVGIVLVIMQRLGIIFPNANK